MYVAFKSLMKNIFQGGRVSWKHYNVSRRQRFQPIQLQMRSLLSLHLSKNKDSLY